MKNGARVVVAVGVLVADAPHLIHDLSLGGARPHSNLLMRDGSTLRRSIGQKVLASQQEYLLMKATNYRDFRLFFLRVFGLHRLLQIG